MKNFELPSDIAKSLTDAGHTAAGFATLAAKKANDARLDGNARFEPQMIEARKRALAVVESMEEARLRFETTIDPMIDRAIGRLPENVGDAIAEYRTLRNELAAKAHDNAVKAIEFATAVPVAAKSAKGAAPSSASSMTAPKAAATAKGPKTATTAKAPKAPTRRSTKAATSKVGAAATKAPRTTAVRRTSKVSA